MTPSNGRERASESSKLRFFCRSKKYWNSLKIISKTYTKYHIFQFILGEKQDILYLYLIFEFSKIQVLTVFVVASSILDRFSKLNRLGPSTERDISFVGSFSFNGHHSARGVPYKVGDRDHNHSNVLKSVQSKSH